jgi:hypothetical protein
MSWERHRHQAGSGWHFLPAGLLAICLLIMGCSDTEPPSGAEQVAASDPSARVPRGQTTHDSPAGDAPAATPDSGRPEREVTPDTSGASPEQGASDAPVAGGFGQEYRLTPDLPPLNDAVLAANGIRRYESRHLILLSDLPAHEIAGLPELVDALFDELQERTSPLLPAANGQPFRVLGCLIAAEERFRAADLMPPDGFTVRHGRHLGYRFWMYNPTSDYYRRHLLLHEFVHCFMMCEFGMTDIPPLWYTEGIAEYFATHHFATGRNPTPDVPRFGIMPAVVGELEGWGRISEIQRCFDTRPAAACESAGMVPLQDILFPADSSFVDDRDYAFAWAICWLLRSHPFYRAEFGDLFAVRRGQTFGEVFRHIPNGVVARLELEWPVFIDSLCEGFDVERAFPVHRESNGSRQVKLALVADRGWQDTGVIIAPGEQWRVSCSGTCQVNDDPRPWITEPQGITIDYHRGRPLGEVVAMLVSSDGRFASRRIAIGRENLVTSDVPAHLWLQVNDSAASRADNGGQFEVTVAAE